jgi:16S rRNA (guanine966-N2)-methyltransferase
MRILAGRFKGRALPVVGEARPAGARLRTSLFSVLAPVLAGARALDVCAGAGALGLEALSRGARHVTLVDVDPRVVAALAAWLAKVGAGEDARALRADALRGPWPPGPFHLVFLDPPFPFWQDERAARLLAHARGVVAPDGRAVVKLPARHRPAEDPAWEVIDRRAAGDAAFAILAPR